MKQSYYYDFYFPLSLHPSVLFLLYHTRDLINEHNFYPFIVKCKGWETRMTCDSIFRSGFSDAMTWSVWLKSNSILLVTCAVVALLTLIVLLLLGSHLYLVSLNTTTWEFMSRHRISYLKHCGVDENPFDRGTLRNLWSFFCVWSMVVWEQVYFRQGCNPA